MIKVELVGGDKVVAAIENITPRVLLRVQKAVRDTTIAVEGRAREKLSGQVLNVRTGRLRRSITSKITEGESGAIGTVGTNVSYARIHEFGGTTRAHVIRARNAKSLKFSKGGLDVFRTSVNHPGSKIPERSFLRSSLRELMPMLMQRLKVKS